MAAGRRPADKVVIKVEGLVGGQESPYDGEYLVEYDPERDGEDPRGYPMVAVVRTSADPAEAKRFDDAAAATEEWRRTCRRQPRRGDGKPNRPLTAFNIAILPEADLES